MASADRLPEESCIFCQRVAHNQVVAANELAAAFHDAFPVSPGHTLVVPRRHVADFFELTEPERAAVLAIVVQVKGLLDGSKRPDGYNVGLNVGAAAGQTVGHAHVHVIPRYEGDADDPRGGVRWIMPGQARYW